MKNTKTNTAAFINNYGELSNELGHGKTFATIDEEGKVRSTTGDFNSFYAESIEEVIEVLNEEIIPYMDFEEKKEEAKVTKKSIKENITTRPRSGKYAAYVYKFGDNELFRNRSQQVYLNGHFYDVCLTKNDFVDSIYNLLTNIAEQMRVNRQMK